MNKLRISLEMRLWFIGPISMLWLGIYFTGYDAVHWLIYLPAIMAIFALVTGLCPGMFVIRKVLEVSQKK